MRMLGIKCVVPFRIYFSPNGNTAKAIVNAITDVDLTKVKEVVAKPQVSEE